MDFVFANDAIFQFTDQGRCAQRHLIHAVAAIDHHRMFGPQALERAHLNAHQIGVKHAHQDIRSGCRISQRPQQIENGLDAHFTAHRSHVFHGRVVIRREHKTDAGLSQTLSNLDRREVDIDAQRLHHIGAAALAADAAPAVFADPRTGSGRHKHGASGDVEGVRTIAACAHNIHQMGLVDHLHLGGKLAHDLRSSGDLANGFLLDAQTRRDGGDHHRRHLARHDLAHQVQHLVVENFAVFDGALQGLLRRDLAFGLWHQGLLKVQKSGAPPPRPGPRRLHPHPGA